MPNNNGAEANANGDGKEGGQGQNGNAGANSGNQNASDNANVDIQKVLTENENLRTTVSTLTKKVNKFGEVLKGAFSEDGENTDQNKDPLKAIQALTAELQTLKAENKQTKAKNMLNDVVDQFTTEDGKPLTDKVKRYIKQRVTVNEPDPDAIKQVVASEASMLLDILGPNGGEVAGGTNNANPDKRPQGRGHAGVNNNPSSANEILEAMKKA